MNPTEKQSKAFKDFVAERSFSLAKKQNSETPERGRRAL